MKDFLTIKETASMLGYSRRAVAYWAEKKTGLGRWVIHIDGVACFPRDRVHEYLNLNGIKK